MWTVLFGDNEDGASSAQSTERTVKTPASPYLSTPPVTPSLLDSLAPSPSPPLSPEQRRDRSVVNAKSTKSSKEESDDSAMRMLLKRLNTLMIKVGEHEFEKRTLVDQIEKERTLLTTKSTELEKQIEDLQDQNVQLQYKVEYTSEPMLMERVQDITDMRDALAAVKKQLEAELQEKDTELRELQAAVARKVEEMNERRDDYEKRIEELTAEREAARNEAAEAIQAASEIGSKKYEEQLKEKDGALHTIQKENEMLEANLAEKDQALRETEAAVANIQRSLEEAHTHRVFDANALELLKQELEQVAQEHEQRLLQVKMESQHELETLKKRDNEYQALAAEKAQELEDYKHDCVELWNSNEELKQQVASMSAEAMRKQSEVRENALAGQLVFKGKTVELEKQLEELQDQLKQKSEQVVRLQKELDTNSAIDDEVSGEDNDALAVVTGDGGVVTVLTEQVATAQRELTEAMELNLHLNARNAWLEEQYQMLSSVQSEGDEEQEEPGLTTHSPAKRITELEQEIQEARFAANEKAEHVSNLEHNYSALSTEFDRLHVAQAELVKVKQTHDATLITLKQEIELLRASQAEKDQALFEKEQEIAEFCSKNTALGSEVDRLHKAESQMQQEYNALIKVQTDLVETRATNATLQQELAVVRERCAAAVKCDEHAAVIQNKLNQARSEKDAVVTLLDQAQASIHELQLKIQELERIVKDQMDGKKSLEQQLQNLQEVAQENMESSYELQSNLETTMEELAIARAQLQTEQETCASLQQSIAEVKQSSISRAELERAQSAIAHLEQQLRHYHGQEQSLKQQLQEAEVSKQAIAAELETAVSERVAAEQEQKRLEVLCEQKISSAQSLSKELQGTNADLTRSLEQSQTKATQAEQQLSTMRAHHSERQKQIETLTKKNLSLVSEIQTMRDEAEKQQQVASSQLEQLKVAHADIQLQLADTSQSLQNKNAELAAAIQRNQSNVAQLEDLASRYKADKQYSNQQLEQLNRECEHLRQAHKDNMATGERSQHELEQIRAQLCAIQQEKCSLEAELGQLRGLKDEMAHLLQEVDKYKSVNQRLEEMNRELEGLLQKSKAYCKEVSCNSENEVSRVQEMARHVEQEARDEIDRIANENNLLRDELAQLAQARFEETNAHDALHVKLAELLAENNVLSARAHRLTQQLSQYTDLPEDDELAAAERGQTPDLWELLSSGMEQLKADLELASKYAASIDASSVDGGDSLTAKLADHEE